MKKLLTLMLAMALLAFSGCTDGAEESKLIVVGFSQVGAESSWRIAHSESMKQAFSEKNGFHLIFRDAKNKQENQYDAIRSFIQCGVDYIVLAPITETGWDNILLEAKKAGIPVIVVDRRISVSDESLYTCWVGSDFLGESVSAVEWLAKELSLRHDPESEKVRILHLQGTCGSTSQLMRTKGLETAVKRNPKWEIAAQFECDYTEAMGYEVTKKYLEQDRNIQVVFSENDNMTFGAIRAMREANVPYGSEGGVIVISFDAVHSALVECMKGNIDLCVECNPLHGPRIVEVIRLLEKDQNPPKVSYVEESVFSRDTLTDQVISLRAY